MSDGGLPFYDITPFTAIDYPGRLAAVLWVAGCNLRCAYCYNPEIVAAAGRLGVDDALAFLARRRGLLDGIVLSGGEPTIRDDLPAIMAALRGAGMALKLDTNGMRPAVVRALLERGLVDAIACDYKAPPGRIGRVTPGFDAGAFRETLDLLVPAPAGVDVAFRTTWHSALLDRADIEAVMADLAVRGHRGPYAVQHARTGHTLRPLSPSQPDWRPEDLVVPDGLSVSFEGFGAAGPVCLPA
ncbi:MAG: anaerobic ribonucleoside-triphosphate reductase activating protein [Alphaproteobacteria bacterium]